MDRDFFESIAGASPYLELAHVPYDHLMVMEAPDAVAEIILDFGRDRKAA